MYGVGLLIRVISRGLRNQIPLILADYLLAHYAEIILPSRGKVSVSGGREPTRVMKMVLMIVCTCTGFCNIFSVIVKHGVWNTDCV